MQLGIGRRHMFEVGEHPTGPQGRKNLGVQRALACIDGVVDGEARHHGVERSHVRQRVVEVVGHQFNAVHAVEPLGEALHHGWRELHAHAEHSRVGRAHQSQQPTVTGAEVGHPLHRPVHRRQHFQHHLFTFGAVRDGVGQRQVGQGMVHVGPQVFGHDPVSPATCVLCGRHVWAFRVYATCVRHAGASRVRVAQSVGHT